MSTRHLTRRGDQERYLIDGGGRGLLSLWTSLSLWRRYRGCCRRHAGLGGEGLGRRRGYHKDPRRSSHQTRMSLSYTFKPSRRWTVA